LNWTNEILIDLGTHETLEYLDLQNTKILEEAIQEQRIASNRLVIVGPEATPPVAVKTMKARITSIKV
jgi:hypothetical protein